MLNLPNKLFYRIVFVLGIILLLTACEGRPKGVLSQSKMTNVLTDLHKLDGYLAEKGFQYGHYPEKTPYYNFILKKHGITEAEFDSSLVWYTKNPKTFDKIYANVLIQLTNQENDVKSGKYHPVESAEMAMMKINIWNKRTQYNLTNDSARTRLDFDITNSSLLLGDIYVLRFLQRIAPEDSCSKQHVILRINYTNGKSDSAYIVTYNDSLLRRYTFQLAAVKKLKIKSISGELLGSKTYKGKFNVMLDSITLIREFNGLKQDSLRKIVQKADSLLYNKKPSKLKTVANSPVSVPLKDIRRKVLFNK